LRILGIDPGLGATGYGVIADGRAVAFGTIKTDSRADVPVRLHALGQALKRVIRRTRPERCALETLFFKGGGARSVILSAESRGAIIYTLACARIPVVELTPASIKLALTGSGRASKGQMNYMVRALLKLSDRVPEHAADALAAAYCLSRRTAYPAAGARPRSRLRHRWPAVQGRTA
jgi:crossover junction endodeoxyribonuclease RuvC